MVTTSTLIEAQVVDVDRYRFSPTRVSPAPVARRVDLTPRSISPVMVGSLGDVCPQAGREPVTADWHQHMNSTTPVFGGRFAGLAVDIKTRVGPPPRRRPSV
ncbi:MAG TPA: hypothetical protein VFP34_19115 [Microlunatus sp.]|nr:hypothetical protein [Microlunatus sp.]